MSSNNKKIFLGVAISVMAVGAISSFKRDGKELRRGEVLAEVETSRLNHTIRK